jgi:hypothetical protein
MVSKKSRIEMSVGGAEKISLWKYEKSYGKWVECPNLPKSFLQKYLSRGFVQSPPDPEVPAEEKVESFSEAVASGKLEDVAPVKKKRGRPRKKV